MRLALALALLALTPGCITAIARKALVRPSAHATSCTLLDLRFEAQPVADVEVRWTDGRTTRRTVTLHDLPPATTPLRVARAPEGCLPCGGLFGLSRLFPPKLMPEPGGGSFVLEGGEGDDLARGGAFSIAPESPTLGSHLAFWGLVPFLVPLDVVLLPVEVVLGLISR